MSAVKDGNFTQPDGRRAGATATTNSQVPTSMPTASGWISLPIDWTWLSGPSRGLRGYLEDLDMDLWECPNPRLRRGERLAIPKRASCGRLRAHTPS